MSENHSNVGIPTELQKSVGFVVYFPKERQDVARLYGQLPLKSILVSFIVDVVDLIASKSTEEFCSYIQIQEYLGSESKPNSKSMIYNRVNKLVEIGIFTESQFKVEGKNKPIRLFTMQDPVIDSTTIDPKHLANSKPTTTTDGNNDKRAVAARTENKLREKFKGQMMEEKPEFMSYQRDHFVTTVISKCISHDPRDQDTKLTTSFKYLDDVVDVITTTLTDQTILASSDLRYTVILTTYCLRILRDFLQKTGNPDIFPANEFVIDLNMVVKELGNLSTTGNRYTAYRAIKRLYTTNFEIASAQGSEFADRFLDGYNEINYRYLTEFKAIVYDAEPTDDFFSADLDETISSEEIKNPRWIKISLYKATFEKMWKTVCSWQKLLSAEEFKNANFLLQNPEVVKNNQAYITLQLHSHLRSWVGLDGYEKKRCNTAELHKYMLPNARYQNFRRDLLKLLNSVNERSDKITLDNPTFKVNFYGYFIEGRPLTTREERPLGQKKGFHLTFYRDPQDDWVGDQSAHQLLLKAAAAKKEQSEGDLDDDLRSGRAVDVVEGDFEPVDEFDDKKMGPTAEFHRLRQELGKDPDDIDIPPAQVYTEAGEAELKMDEYPLFAETRKK